MGTGQTYSLNVSLRFQDSYYFLRVYYKKVTEKHENEGLLSGQQIFQG